ncbi:MAG: hypothetical protein F6K11_38115, partial [Leptolyngbya sp. SIO3F4]|nr:hypothetical protein [Leptolyngbya sp. SIO3F4]
RKIVGRATANAPACNNKETPTQTGQDHFGSLVVFESAIDAPHTHGLSPLS